MGERNEMKGWTFWETYADVMEELTVSEQKDYLWAIVRYMNYDDDQERNLKKNVRIAFKGIKGNLNRSKVGSTNSKNKTKPERNSNETATNRERNENKTPLSLSLSSRLNSRSKDGRAAVGSAAADAAPPTCPKCGSNLFKTGTGQWRCNPCGEVVA